MFSNTCASAFFSQKNGDLQRCYVSQYICVRGLDREKRLFWRLSLLTAISNGFASFLSPCLFLYFFLIFCLARFLGPSVSYSKLHCLLLFSGIVSVQVGLFFFAVLFQKTGPFFGNPSRSQGKRYLILLIKIANNASENASVQTCAGAQEIRRSTRSTRCFFVSVMCVFRPFRSVQQMPMFVALQSDFFA